MDVLPYGDKAPYGLLLQIPIVVELHESGLAAPKLAQRYKDVRNQLSHDYMRLPNEFLWAALQDLPQLLESVELHTTPPVSKGRNRRAKSDSTQSTAEDAPPATGHEP